MSFNKIKLFNLEDNPLTNDSPSLLSLDNASAPSASSLATPTAPTLLSGQIIDKVNATLSWSAPLLSGSSSISKYNIYKVVGQAKTLLGNTTNLTFTILNLDQWQTYNFGVAAVNSENLEGPLTIVTLNTACFIKGTKILYWNEANGCEEYIPIENLKKGMKVKTSLNGYLKIEAIGKSILYNAIKTKHNKDGLFKLNKFAYPELFEDLYMTGAHSVLKSSLTEEQFNTVKEILGDIYITGDKYRYPLCADDLAEPHNEIGDFEILHFALENSDYYSNYGVYANGLLVETTSIRYMKEVYECELIE